MDISLEMLFSEFSKTDQDSVVLCSDKSRIIRNIQLFSGKEKEPESNYLYVIDCTSSKPQSKDDDALVSSTGIYLSIVSSSKKSSAKKKSVDKNVCEIRTSREFADVYNHLLDCFLRFDQWHNRLSLAVLSEAPFQEFIDISEEFIRSPMLIFDPSLKLMAHTTRQTPAADELYQKCISLGYLEYEAFQYFSEDHLLDELEEKGSVQGSGDLPFRKSADYIRTIRVGNELAIYCIFLYNESLSKEYSHKVFEIFCDHIQQLLEKQHRDFTKGRTISDYLLEEILNSPSLSSEEIQQRTAYSDLSYSGNYVFISLHFSPGSDSSNYYFIWALRNEMMSCRVFPYQGNIVILFNLPRFQSLTYKSYLTDKYTELLDHFSDRNPVMYVSRPFEDLSFLAAAYEQAENTCALTAEQKGNIFFYEDYVLQDFLFMNASKQKLFSYCCPWMMELKRDGSRKARQQLTVLKAYIENGLKPTEAALQLGMHRNNIIYHIRNLEETYRVHLDDASEILKIQLSFLLLESFDHPGSDQ